MADPLAAGGDDPLAKAEAMRGQAMASQQSYDKTMTAGLADVKSGQADLAATRAARPTPAPTPEAPKGGMGDDAALWISAATIMGAIGAAAGRQNTVASLNAFTGVLEGAKEGNQQKFEQKAKEWEYHSKRVAEQNQQMLSSYEATLSDKKTSMEEKLLQLQLQAKQHQDDQMFQLASMRDYISVGQLQEARMKNQREWDVASHKIHNDEEKLELAKREQSRKETVTASGVITDEDASLAADAVKHGNYELMNKFGRGAQGPGNLRRIMDALEQSGATGEQLSQAKAEQRSLMSAMGSLGTREANLGTIANAAKNAIPLALKNSEATQRGGTVLWNSAQGKWDVQTGDAAWAAHVASTNALVNLYARAIGGGQMTVSAAEHAREMLNPTMPPAAYNSTVRTIAQEIENELRAPGQTRDQMMGRAPPVGADTGGGPKKVNTPDEAAKLPPGTHYVTPDGREFTR